MNAFALRAALGTLRLDARAEWNAPCAALFGASGSGKSTILEALAGVRRDVAGSVQLCGRRLEGVPARARRVGWVPQDAALFPHLTAGENVAFGVRPRGDAGLATRAIDALELGPVLGTRAADLSGGERQRVAIARALASRPQILLLDEPLASIDRPLRVRLLPFLAQLPELFGTPMLLVTHDPLEVLALAQRVLVLEAGRIVAAGDPRGVFAASAAFASLQALTAENVFAVTSLDREGGLARARTAGGCEVWLAVVPGFPAPRHVAIPAEEILLAVERPRGISAQNVLAGRVTRVEPIGEQALVHVRCAGETWRAKVTQRAVVSLELAPGREVFLIVKAHAVHALDARPGASR